MSEIPTCYYTNNTYNFMLNSDGISFESLKYFYFFRFHLTPPFF